ncbi:hypothetical protein RRG08_065162 [Elysia crispata]|uniref:Uncharacterized protein n=1 Tax=Elysia crispata TaxID=231223 RepID=A0AAE0Z0P8_9GAST|nr:hypothetical protein RRG08_065162 [Elysia crispata]
MGLINCCLLAFFLICLSLTEAILQKGCVQVTLKSKPARPDSRILRDSSGAVREVVKVKVWDQISKLPCVEWVNYFYYGNIIIAKDGCAATFKVCYKPPQPATTPAPLTTIQPGCDFVQLLSSKNKKALVRFPDVTISSMTLIRQFSSSKVDCIIRRTFGFRANRAVARKGCRGLFQVCFDTAQLTTVSPETCKKFKILKPTRITVRDSNSQPATISSVVLEREISKHVCREGVNYFFRGSTFIVRGGCKGVFTVCYTENTTPAPLTTTQAPITCKKIDVRSRGSRPRRVDVTDSNGDPVIIVKVHVWDQISKVKCRQGVNFFVGESSITARNGCQATFKVCYRPAPPVPVTLTTPAPDTCKKFKILKPTRITVRDSNSQPATISSVVLEREISKHVCREGVNFFFRGSRFIVRGGCKGVFTVCYTENTTPAPLTKTQAPITCKKIDVRSRGSRPRRVDVTDSNGDPVIIVKVHVWDQISKVKCRQGVNFFVGESSITARNGCQATFKVCYRPAPPVPVTLTTPAPDTCKKFKILKPTRITVRDSNSQPATISSVVLEREISKHVCREGVNFFFRGSRFIVRGGCKGVFTVCYTENTTPAPLTTTQAPITCKKIDVRSRGSRPRRVDVTDSNGDPVIIVKVHVWDQISKVKCRQGVNFFVGESSITARNGCQATFKVCYRPAPPVPVTLTTPAPDTCKKFKILKPTRITVRDSNSQPATISSVVLEREISKHVCREGVNFFFRGSRFIVRGGCKGVFTVCFTENPATPTPLTTEAPEPKCKRVTVRRGRVNVTDADGRPVNIVKVKVWDQISVIKCVRGVNYFVSDSAITVRQGCQATFKVCFFSIATTPVPLTTAPPVQCKIHKVLTPTRKNIVDDNNNPVTIEKVVLVREISKHVCQQNTNYFFRDSRFVVKHGCKGIFKICFTPTQTTPAMLTTTTAAPQPKCKKVTVKSKGKKPARADILDSNGNPVHIASVGVWDQISKVKCIKWVNYFYSEFFIIVKKGCQATFKVCYVEKTPPTTPAFLTTTTGGPKCRKYTLEGPVKKELHDSRGEPAVITDLKLVRDFTKGGCVESKTFRVSGSTIRIGSYCKGVFLVCYLPAPPPTTTAQLTTANPEEKCRKYTIAVPTTRELLDADKNPAVITRVDLVKEVQNGRCIRDVNFMFSGSTLTVRGTCKGVFLVCIVPGPQQLTTAPPRPTRECQKINLDGTGSKPDIKTISSSNGRRITIKSIRLIKEISKNVCKEWVNFFASGNTVIAKKGCKGKFKVCYDVL